MTITYKIPSVDSCLLNLPGDHRQSCLPCVNYTLQFLTFLRRRKLLATHPPPKPRVVSPSHRHLQRLCQGHQKVDPSIRLPLRSSAHCLQPVYPPPKQPLQCLQKQPLQCHLPKPLLHNRHPKLHHPHPKACLSPLLCPLIYRIPNSPKPPRSAFKWSCPTTMCAVNSCARATAG